MGALLDTLVHSAWGCIWEAAEAAGGKPQNEGLTQKERPIKCKCKHGQHTAAA